MEDMEEKEVITGLSIKLFQLTQEKLKLFLEPTEKAISDSI